MGFRTSAAGRIGAVVRAARWPAARVLGRQGHPLARRLAVAVNAFLLASLIAFLWQGFATGTHLDFAPGTFAAASSDSVSTSRVTHPMVPGERPFDCPTCRDASIAGHFLSPADFVFLTVLAAAPWLAAVAILLPSLAQRSHIWRSRAPPAAA